jgi:hypothetical protein
MAEARHDKSKTLFMPPFKNSTLAKVYVPSPEDRSIAVESSIGAKKEQAVQKAERRLSALMVKLKEIRAKNMKCVDTLSKYDDECTFRRIEHRHTSLVEENNRNGIDKRKQRIKLFEQKKQNEPKLANSVSVWTQTPVKWTTPTHAKTASTISEYTKRANKGLKRLFTPKEAPSILSFNAIAEKVRRVKTSHLLPPPNSSFSHTYGSRTLDPCSSSVDFSIGKQNDFDINQLKKSVGHMSHFELMQLRKAIQNRLNVLSHSAEKEGRANRDSAVRLEDAGFDIAVDSASPFDSDAIIPNYKEKSKLNPRPDQRDLEQEASQAQTLCSSPSEVEIRAYIARHYGPRTN